MSRAVRTRRAATRSLPTIAAVTGTCPKCQGSQAREWLEARKAELLEVPYFHVVFTLPPRIGSIAFQNKAVIYDLLFKASAETLLTIAADPKRLGVRIGFTSVLHTWGSAMTHHPHVHMERRRSAPAFGARKQCRSAAREIERGNGLGSTQP